jgi:hypothetical protein
MMLHPFTNNWEPTVAKRRSTEIIAETSQLSYYFKMDRRRAR